MDRLDHLRIFLRIAQCSSFTQAADQLGLPRASVSGALQQLEARLGTRLLHRTTRRVRLTPDGESLLERARSLVHGMEVLEQQFSAAGQGMQGRLRVDVPSRIAHHLLAPALPEFLARHPGIVLELGSNDRTVDLAQEGVDCALRVGALAPSGLVARPLGTFSLINCASPDYLQRHGAPANVADLQAHGHRQVNYAPSAGGRYAPWEWVEDGQLRTMVLAGYVAASNVETYIACAVSGMGLIQVPAFDVQEQLLAGTLVDVMPLHRAPPMPVHLVYPHRRHLAQRVQAFGDWIETMLAPHLD
ncbi:LysR family transcriptional regulator [Pseudorhodoferax soli]|uniref:LysR family transcriptional regulator n=1 Tax=Pseudorhodoferax soli TaxID=545864 RepID=A0A368XK12_9BURK|nr:LysR family transcriptional regulator [Pseudorhodoferax soli]RCW68185.1 LysR family transcriptional regulator [Pseudorhodoferax soli]